MNRSSLSITFAFLTMFVSGFQSARSQENMAEDESEIIDVVAGQVRMFRRFQDRSLRLVELPNRYREEVMRAMSGREDESLDEDGSASRERREMRFCLVTTATTDVWVLALISYSTIVTADGILVTGVTDRSEYLSSIGLDYLERELNRPK